MNPTKSLAAFLALAFLISAIFGTLPTRPAQAANITGKANIVCIGDSITEGRGSAPSFTSYRYPLFKKLVDAVIDFEMVGPKQGNFITNLTFDPYKTKTFSNRHYSFFGIKASVLKNNVYNDLLPINFNTAIILLGTNDRVIGTDAVTLASAQQIANDLASIVTSLRTINPNVLVFFVGLPDNWKPVMNQQMQLKAQEISTAQSTVTYIAQPAGWIADPANANTDTLDWAHPNAKGDDKLAQQIFNGIAPFLSTGTSTASPIATATPTRTPTPTAAPTSSAMPTPTKTPTPAPTLTPTQTPTPTPTPGIAEIIDVKVFDQFTETYLNSAHVYADYGGFHSSTNFKIITSGKIDTNQLWINYWNFSSLIGYKTVKIDDYTYYISQYEFQAQSPETFEVKFAISNTSPDYGNLWSPTVFITRVFPSLTPTSAPTATPTQTPTPKPTLTPTPIPIKPPITVTKVKLNKTTLTLYKGKISKLIATVLPTNALNKKVTWKSTNKAIVTVSAYGTLKGIKKGTAYVFVYTRSGNKSAKCKVVVK